MDKNVDYKEMYLTMVRATEEAIRLLIQAQQSCEEQYLQQAIEEKPPIVPLPQSALYTGSRSF